MATGLSAGLRGTSGDVRETSAEDCCAAVAYGPGSLLGFILASGMPYGMGTGPSRGSTGHVRQCPGDFRGRLLSHGGSTPELVADFYPRHRHVVGHGGPGRRAGFRGTFGSVSGRLPRKTPAPRWPTGRARCRFLSSPPASPPPASSPFGMVCAVGAGPGCLAAGRRGSVPATGDRRG
jgi:hypothetical protein